MFGRPLDHGGITQPMIVVYAMSIALCGYSQPSSFGRLCYVGNNSEQEGATQTPCWLVTDYSSDQINPLAFIAEIHNDFILVATPIMQPLQLPEFIILSNICFLGWARVKGYPRYTGIKG